MDVLILLGVSICIYFIPTFVASERKHQNFAAIVIVNIFLGWTFIGWVAALVWAFTQVSAKGPEVQLGALPPPLPAAARLAGPAFEPDGVLASVPYRVADDGSIEAVMQGMMVRFGDFDKFTNAVNRSS
ncbi:superinfection immunity protein [Bradyrhizobium sp. C9]|uniref:superinfection immunity protein n=1 Tax=Bradyrhizobium sp. C9 TaxID=142585 RepID=UPI000BE7F582|nr:superinfection immunity protein [Bradyrhizobium sp. C9]PDT77153.1 hypothetical protein CO675_11480 [Bradyrhizobium sp. C9]